jgi:hypothetical protein
MRVLLLDIVVKGILIVHYYASNHVNNFLAPMNLRYLIMENCNIIILSNELKQSICISRVIFLEMKIMYFDDIYYLAF